MNSAALKRITEKWGEGSLYMFLMEHLPSYRTAYSLLDIHRIADELDLTYQGVYRWMGARRLRPENAELLLKLCVAEAGRNAAEAPTIDSFTRFVFPA